MTNASRPKVAVRIVRADGGPETVVPMTGETLIAGRSGEVTIPDDPFIATQQMRLFFSGARLAVEDIGGGNGVFARLRNDRALVAGGEIRVGRQRLLIEAVLPATPGVDGAAAWGSPDTGARYRLVQVFEGGQRGGAWLVADGETQVGREAGDIVFPYDGFVSGRHATVTAAPDRLSIRDLGSSNGTFVRLAAPTFVENGDQFLVGRQLVRVELG